MGGAEESEDRQWEQTDRGGGRLPPMHTALETLLLSLKSSRLKNNHSRMNRMNQRIHSIHELHIK